MAVALLVVATGGAAQPVRLQLKWYHQFQFAGYYAAEARGYYAEEGLNVRIIEGGASRSPILEVVAGGAEFGVSDTEILVARLKGEELVVCAAVFQHSPYIILSRADRGIRSPHDLIGKRVMTAHDQGSVQLAAMLRMEGVDPARLNFIPHSWDLRDLVDGRVDAMSAYATVEPFQLEAMGIESAMIRTLDYGVDFYGDTLFTTEAYVAQNLKTTSKVVRASMRGWSYAMEHPQEMVDLILGLPGVRERGITRAQLTAEAAAMRELIVPDLVEIGHLNPGRWQRIADTYVTHGLAPAGGTLDGFIFDPVQRSNHNVWRRLAVVIAIVGAGVLLVAVWSLQVRRQVRRRTEELRAEAERRARAEEEQRMLAEKLEVEHARLTEAQAVARLGNWENDLVAGTVWWSDETHHIFETDERGHTPTDEAFYELVHPADRARVRAAFEGAVTLRGPQLLEHRLLLAGDRVKHVEQRWQTFFDASGRSIRMAGTCQDITDRRRLEEQFLRAQRMEGIGTLTGGMAHDLINLLVPIIMGAEMLGRSNPDEATRRVLSNVERSAKRAGALVKQVLSFSRGVDGPREAVQLDLVVTEIEGIVHSTFPKNIELACAVAPDLWPVDGDPTHLNQVLLNLCVNARDAMPQGGRLEIVAANRTLAGGEGATPAELVPGPYVVLTVSDTGMGMTAEVRDRVFEPFYTTKDVGKGSGLGLSTVLGIIRGYGGVVELRSEPGRGSVFTIYLPANVTTGVVRSEPRVFVPAPEQGAGELVLLVDDETDVRMIAAESLRIFGYRTVEAVNGAEGLALFRQKRDEIALLLTDIMMPVMGGLELIQEVRALAPALPVVAVSGLGDQAMMAQINAAQVTRFVGKPFTPDQLASAVWEALVTRRTGD